MTKPILGYATNCYSGESAAELIAAVRTEVAAVRKQLPVGEPLNLSLRISTRAALEFNNSPWLLDELQAVLNAAGARVIGANAFPVSAPQDGIYKDRIYKPDWTRLDRVEATFEIACALSKLLPKGQHGVLTTMTGLYRPEWESSILDFMEGSCADFLQLCAEELESLSKEIGRELVLALEPEPFTTADSLDGTIRYFKERLYRGPNEAVARRRLAVNLDLCHAAVMFEDAAENLRAYAREGIPVAGLHVSAALRLPDPGANHAGLAALRSFDEPVYLHQTCAVDRAGRVAFRSADLGEFLALPEKRLSTFAEARVHFHVPIFMTGVEGRGARGEANREDVAVPVAPSHAPSPTPQPLATTADLIAPALREALSGGHADLFVVETYTWKLLEGTPGAAATTAEGIARELTAARAMMPAI